MSTNQFNRQPIHAIVADLGVANIGAGNGVTAKLPMGAQVVSANALVIEAFNTAGDGAAATLSVKDDTNTFVNAQSVTSTGAKTVALKDAHYAEGGEIEFSLAEAGDTPATEGRVVAVVQYVVVGGGGTIYG